MEEGEDACFGILCILMKYICHSMSDNVIFVPLPMWVMKLWIDWYAIHFTQVGACLVSQEGIILGEDEAVLLQNALYTLLCIRVCINLIMRVPGVLGLWSVVCADKCWSVNVYSRGTFMLEIHYPYSITSILFFAKSITFSCLVHTLDGLVPVLLFQSYIQEQE